MNALEADFLELDLGDGAALIAELLSGDNEGLVVLSEFEDPALDDGAELDQLGVGGVLTADALGQATQEAVATDALGQEAQEVRRVRIEGEWTLPLLFASRSVRVFVLSGGVRERYFSNVCTMSLPVASSGPRRPPGRAPGLGHDVPLWAEVHHRMP